MEDENRYGFTDNQIRGLQILGIIFWVAFLMGWLLRGCVT